jgi:Calpain family cysteine protease
VLFRDNVSHLDVVQGALGDCYFLSAISVLGESNVRAMIVIDPNEPELWKKLGCFCVRFFKEGDEEWVLVDDLFPVK